MSQQFSLFDTIQSHVEDFESQLYTGMPAIVESYNPEDCTVDCYPAIYAIEKDGVVQKEQILEAVPVIFPSASGVAITFPIKKGDSVWLQFSMRDMTEWLEGTEEYSVPPTMRKHNMNDAVAFAGVHKYSKSPVKNKDNLNIYYGDSELNILPNGNINLSSPENSIQMSLKDGITIDTSGGNSIKVLQNGNVELNVSKLSISNDAGELIDWIVQLINILETTTVNTIYGVSPLNSTPQLGSLKALVESMKT